MNKNKITGIYKITNLVNNKFYIGSSTNLKLRKINHFSRLKNNNHANKHLQSSYNKYGKENFIYEIIAFCPPEYIIKFEQWFLDNMKPKYNIFKIAGCNHTGIKRKPLTDERKALLSKASSEWIRSEEYCENMRKIKTGVSIPNSTKKIINIETNEIYASVKELSNITKRNISYYQMRLTGKVINKTPYRYIDGSSKMRVRKNFPVVLFDKSDRKIEIFNNAIECHEFLKTLNYNIKIGYIKNCCVRKHKKHRKFYFRSLKDC